MKLFSKKTKSNSIPVWRDSNGSIRCLGDDCLQKECDETCPIWRQTIATELIKKKAFGEALIQLEEAVKIAPDYYAAWNNMGSVHGRGKSYQKSYDCYLKAHELEPENWHPIIGLAKAAYDLRLYEESLRWCNQYDKVKGDGLSDVIRVSALEALGQTNADADSEVNEEIIHKNEKTGYVCVRRGDEYYFLDRDGDEICTPAGLSISTNYRELADRIFNDIVAYGLYDMGPYSILPWHYTMIDNFSRMGKEMVQEVLKQSFFTIGDWTFSRKSKEWKEVFGTEASRYDEINAWFSKCSVMQLTAACCIGNAYWSINLPFAMAKILEMHPGEDKRAAMKKFSDLAAKGAKQAGMGSASEIMRDFETFDLYYGIHLKENGNIIT